MTVPHGFRIYVVEAYHDQVKDHDPIDVSASSDARDHILDVLEDLHAAGTYFIYPRVPPKPGDPEKPTVSVSVGQPVVVRHDLVHVPVSVGELGAHRHATRPGKAARSLEKWSAEEDHTVTFVFPKVADQPILAIASSYRRRDAMSRLLSLITGRSLEMKKSAKQAEDDERARIKALGDKPPKRQAHTRLLFTKRQGSDSGYLDEIINDAKTVTAHFEQRVHSDRGRRAETVRRSLSIRLLDESDRKAGKSVSKKWAQKLRKGNAASKTDGVSELAGELATHDLVTVEEATIYTDASIYVSSDSGVSTTIAVDTLRDVFTYPVSEGKPPALYYYERVAPRLKIVAAEEDIDIIQLNPMEVEQCLVASTSARS